MRRQLIVNGAILVLALGTLGVVWATRDATTTAQLSARKGKLLDTWNKDQVERITLRRDGKQLELVRDASVGVEGDFRIVGPGSERADIASVSALLGSLDLASSLRAADGVDPKQAGLIPPQLELALQMSGKRQVLKLGGPAPAPPGARYLELQSGSEPARVVVISAGLVTELDVPLDKLREPRLFSLSKDEIARIELGQGDSKVELVRDRAFFVQRGGRRELAARESVSRLLAALSRLVASQLVEPEQARTVLAADTSAVRLRIEPVAKSGPPLSYTLGGACPSDPSLRLALREAAQTAAKAGCVPADVVEGTRLSEDQLVLEHPFAASFDEVESLTVSSVPSRELGPHQPTHLDLKRKGTAFRLSSPSEAEVALEAGNERIQAIVGAKASRPSPALGDPKLWQDDGWISVTLAGSSDSERVVLGKVRPDGSRCLKRELDQVVLCVDAEAAKAFLPDATLLRGSTVTSFAAADVKEVSIETETLRERLERQADGSFALREPAGFAHDGALVTDLVQLLGSLHAERWVAAVQEPAHGLERPRLRARVGLSGSPARELLVGAATDAGFFARLQDDPQVFVLARSALEALETPLIDRALCPFDPNDLLLIELQRGARKVELKRGSDGFETVSALRAEQALHLGSERANEGLRAGAITVTFTSKSGQRRALRVGARDRVSGRSIAYARLDGVDATFALAESSLTALQDF